MKTSGSPSRMKRKSDGGVGSSPSGVKDSPASGSSSAPIPITTDIGGFLRSKTDSEETKRMKLEVELIRAKTEAKIADTKAEDSKAMVKVANAITTLLAKHMEKSNEG